MPGNISKIDCYKTQIPWSWRAAHHCHSIGGQQLLGCHGGEVGNVGHSVDEGHQGDGNVDGSRQVPKTRYD